MLLHSIVVAHRARSSHHKIALDALLRLDHPDAKNWTLLFLSQAETYLAGAKAPDDVFRDSMNHVLHVRDNYWGGALREAQAWYTRLVDYVAGGYWPEAVYAAGVLSHYVVDPFQPLHTAQSEAEGAVHRAFEQSVKCSYTKLKARVDAMGWPARPDTSAQDWLAALIRGGAEASVVHYDACIDHYDLKKGVADPPSGLDAHLQEVMADALGRAIVAFAAVLDRAFAEAAVAPPKVEIGVADYLAALEIPIAWIARKMENEAERRAVEAMYGEFQQTGKVVRLLPPDDLMVRAAHAREVLKAPLTAVDAEPARAPGALHGKPPLLPTLDLVETVSPLIAIDAPAVVGRDRSNPVIDAPAIGKAYAARLEAIGIATIGALIDADPAATAQALAVQAVDEAVVRDWQAMAVLAVGVTGLGERDAELLVGAGVRDARALAASDARALQAQLAAFVSSPAGRKITRGAAGPQADKLEALIAAARDAA
jgi:hypothetical protein